MAVVVSAAGMSRKDLYALVQRKSLWNFGKLFLAEVAQRL